MPHPFPGMNPYLEHPGLWPDVHNSVIHGLRRFLTPRLRPKYFVAVEERAYLADAGLDLVGIPDLAVVRPSVPTPSATSPDRGDGSGLTVAVPVADELHETYLEVREAVSGRVITSIEVLSPSNKRPGEGRVLYQEKRRRVLASRTHLVEVDLVRGGEPMPVLGAERLGQYRILVSRGDQRPRARLLPFDLRDPIPLFRVPLQAGDEEPEVDLVDLLRTLYDEAGYDLRIDYGKDTLPPLSPADRNWARGLLAERGAGP